MILYVLKRNQYFFFYFHSKKSKIDFVKCLKFVISLRHLEFLLLTRTESYSRLYYMTEKQDLRDNVSFVDEPAKSQSHHVIEKLTHSIQNTFSMQF